MNTMTATPTREVYSRPLNNEQMANLLTAQDRCDRCQGQAYFIAFKESMTLMFCRHHFLKADEALDAQGFSVIDQSFLLTDNVNPLKNTKDY